MNLQKPHYSQGESLSSSTFREEDWPRELIISSNRLSDDTAEALGAKVTRNSEDTVPPPRPLREHRGTEHTSELEESLGTVARKQQDRLMRQIMIPIERGCDSRLERGLGQVMGEKPSRIRIKKYSVCHVRSARLRAHTDSRL